MNEHTQLDARIDLIATQLADLQEDLRDLQEDLRTHPKPKTQAATKTLSDLRYWLRQAMETEAQIAERNKRKTGSTAGNVIDLAQARAQIGRRLDRLKRAQRDQELSE